MDQTRQRLAYRCLPLVIANQSGWELLSPGGFSVTWNGGDSCDDVQIAWDDQPIPGVASHFGHGLVTFFFGYIFRTPDGYSLLVGGPPNCPKDGIAPLEGVVETYWAPYTFSMSWKMTRPHNTVQFEKGEPVARILPIPHDNLRTFEPVIRPVVSDVNLVAQFSAWRRRRQTFSQSLRGRDLDEALTMWTGDYFGGRDQRGNVDPAHVTSSTPREFVDEGPKTMSIDEFRAIWRCVVARAWKDEQFKQRLLEDATAVLAEYGVPSPNRPKICVREEMTENFLNLTLPPKAAVGDLLEAYLWSDVSLSDLERIAIEPHPDRPHTSSPSRTQNHRA